MVNQIQKYARLSIVIVFYVFVTQLSAQTGTIKGSVVDAKTNEPLIGASVLIEGTTLGAAADLDGNFEIHNIPAGTHTLVITYVAYKPEKKNGVAVTQNEETILKFALTPDEYALEEVEVVAQANRESENILLLEQKKSLVATQAVGARELSRKGIGNAEAAVTQVSGISKQEGVKNVFVRGLGDRYNATALNGFPIPSEDPEYKNINLGFFGTDIIQNISVNKAFSATNTGDAGGAVIDITSKQLFGDRALSIDVSGGINTSATNKNFLRQDGVDYFGFANSTRPTPGRYNFPNSLDPSEVKLPLNHSYGISLGNMFRLGENRNPLSFFVVATHSSDFSFTEEKVKNTTTDGTIFQDQTGDKYSRNIHQMILTNVDLELNKHHRLAYNFMLIHVNDQYVGDYYGYNSEKFQDSETYMGFYRRQQNNDNLLLTNQLNSKWKLRKGLEFNLGGSYNYVKGLEPDRRENYLSKVNETSYILTGSNRQKRFFSTLEENDFNIKSNIKYQLKNRFGNENSFIRLGYNGRFVNDDFEAVEYYFDALSGTFPIENLKLDDLYNQSNMDAGKFVMVEGDPNTYHVSKYIHSGYVDADYQLFKKLTANVGLKYDYVEMTVEHRVQHTAPGSESIVKNYFLPSVNMKYDLNDKNIFRLGMSKTYTLPQSKEISPYQYVNISFVSQGDPQIKPSDNYNLDLKWEFYPSASELISLTGFYKHIKHPIARVDEGNSAGLLTYTNISDYATVAGMELEIRKNLLNVSNADHTKLNKLTAGFNASYTYSNLEVQIANTNPKNTQLEGAAPFLTNFDVSYQLQNQERVWMTSLVFNYFSKRIHTIGSRTFKDIIEEGIPTMDFVSSYKFNQHLSVKFKWMNVLNPSYKLTRKSSTTDDKVILNEFKKGQNLSLGVSYEL